MSRIESSSIKLGNSFVLGSESGRMGKIGLPQSKELIAEAQVTSDEIIENAKNEAARIIKEAELKAQEIIEQAQLSMEQAQETIKLSYEEAVENGQKSGYDAGYRQIYNDLSEQIKFIDLLAGSVDKVKKEIICSAEREIVELTVLIAQKILKQKLSESPELILNIVKCAISQLKDKEEVRIIVNPVHTNNLFEFSEEFKTVIKGLNSIKIIEDRTIPYDGVLVESGESRIDARLDTQIAEITKKLLDEANNDPELAHYYKEINIKIQ